MAIPGLDSDAVLTIEVEEGGFLVLGMTGFEHLGQMFEYTVELAGALDLLGTPEDVDLHKLVGTRATVKMTIDEVDRFFDGFVVRAKRGEMKGRYPTFKITLKPWLWFATQRKNSKVFQEKSVKEIIEEVLEDYNESTEWKLDSEGDYPKLDYCVQHNETDFDFISRLMEEVGIYYFFTHDEGEHTMVFTDATGKHEALENNDTITWRNAIHTAPTITRWYVQEEARAVKTVLTEYDYLDPTTEIEGEKEFDEAIEEPVGEMEWFEHPALVVQNSAKASSTSASTPATQRATVRMEELTGLYSVATGLTNVQDFVVGGTFELEEAPVDDDNQEYLIVSTIYKIEFNDHARIEELRSNRRMEGFRCEFMCQSVDNAPTFRSPRITPKPVIAGPQTAFVVGASGNEIETDEHGRIKIQFHWDRLGEDDEKSSCWVRVMTPWAGPGYGMFSLPRVGDEVVVQFLDGDPDRPLVVGSVYNKENPPPWPLPDQATVGGVKSRSSKGGDEDTANELRFDDKKGSEYVWFQAEKDFYRYVKNDVFDLIDKNETVKVVETRKEVIGKSWFMDITDDVMHNMGKDLHVTVAGDIFYTGGATWQLKLGKGDYKAEAMNVVIEAKSSLTLMVGGSIVKLSSAGVDIVGAMVKVNSGGGGSPAMPAEAKKEDSLTAPDYDQSFEDPLASAV